MSLIGKQLDGQTPVGGHLIQGKDGSGKAQDILVGTDGRLDLGTIAVSGAGDATAANQATIIGHVDGIEGLLTTIDTDTGGIATSASSIDSKTPALGQALAASSVPVVLTAAQITTLTPPAAITGFATSAKQDTLLAELQLKADLTETQPVSVASLPLPSGAATSANQSTIIGHVDGIEGLLTTIDSDTSALAGAISGTEVQVDIVSSALPSGAATAALQTQPGVDIGDVTINNASGASAVNIQDGGNSITVDATSLPLPTGASTSALQTSSEAILTTIDTDTGNIATSTASIDTKTPALGQALASGSVPVVLTAAQITTLTPPAAITGYATAAAQTDKSQFTKITDGTDTALVTAAGEQNVLATAQPGVDIGDVTINNASGASAVNIQDGGNSITVDAPVGTPAFVRLSDGASAITTLPVSLASVPSHAVTNAGTFVVQENGAALTSLQLIDDVVYTDDTSTHSTGVSKGVGIMATATPTDTSVNANDIGMVAMTTDRRLLVDASGVAVPVTDNSGSITVDQPTGTNLHTVVDSGTITTVSTVTSLTQMNGQAISMGTGVRDAGTQRVTIATNDSVPVTNTVLSVVGGGTEATAQRVTIANDSTGVLSVDDNGSTLSIDDGSGIITTDGSGVEGTPAGGVVTVQGNTGMSPISTRREHLTVPFTTTIVAAVASTDAYQYTEVAVQITSQGTSSTITFQGSNDNTNWVSVPLLISSAIAATAPVTSTTAASSYSGPVKFRYFRLNVTGISAGTTDGTVEFFTTSSYELGSAKNISSLVPGTSATALGKAKDAVAGATDTGVALHAVQKATPANVAGSDGDYDTLQMSAGRLWTSTVVDTALPTGTNNIGDVDVLTVPADPFGANADAASASGSISAKLRFIASTGIPVTGTVTVGSHAVTNAGTFATQDSQTIADNAAFTDGTSKVFAAGYIYDETAGTALTENDVAAGRINVNRALVNAIEDGATRGRYATVKAASTAAAATDTALVVSMAGANSATKIGDGTNNANIKAASTAAAFTDTALTVDPRPGGALVTASAALADALANPTLGKQAVLGHLYNGSTWDLQRGMSVATTTGDSGAKTATGNGATQTNVGNKGVQIFIVLGTVSGTTPTCVFKVQGSVDGGTNWFDLPGAATASLTASNDVGIMIYPGVVATVGADTNGTTATVSLVLPRTWRMVWTIGGTTPSFTITSITYNYIPN